MGMDGKTRKGVWKVIADYVIRGVLSMECEDGRQRPVTFLSKSLNETERNYEIHDKEMLVVIRGLEN